MHIAFPHCYHPWESVDAPAAEVVCRPYGFSVLVDAPDTAPGTGYGDGAETFGRFADRPGLATLTDRSKG